MTCLCQLQTHIRELEFEQVERQDLITDMEELKSVGQAEKKVRETQVVW